MVAFKFNSVCLDSHQDKNLTGDFLRVLRKKGVLWPQFNLELEIVYQFLVFLFRINIKAKEFTLK